MDSTTMLEMLLATDEQVEDDFSFLCQLLEDSPSETAEDSDTSMPNLEQLSTNSSTQPSDWQTTKRKAPKQDALPAVGARNRFQYRQREELKQLRGHVESLKAQLASERLKYQALSKPQDRNQVSQWELAARQQLLERNHALNENKQLKEALEEQSTFLDQMQRFFMKKPRFAALSDGTSSDDWKALKLTAQQSLREAAIHAIADRQYRRMQHAFITAGLFGLAHDKYLSAMPCLQPDGSVLVEVKRQTLHPALFRVVSKAFWDACSAHAFNAEVSVDLASRCSLNALRRTSILSTARRYTNDFRAWQARLESIATLFESTIAKTRATSFCVAQCLRTLSFHTWSVVSLTTNGDASGADK
ncbi:hypothetical protein AC1031_002126 [Aphanomyces cochlioides]|nr:hypothetical protein AC1031_002126 [Aphanomyces cochlioides]